MKIQYGKHAGKITEVLFLKQPDYAQWMMKHAPDSKVTREFKKLKSIFNAKPLIAKKCHSCRAPAARASAYEDTAGLMFWCATCNLYGSGARSGTLTEINSFDTALDHVDWTGGASRADKREIVRELAVAKGLPKRITEAAAIAFFRQSKAA